MFYESIDKVAVDAHGLSTQSLGSHEHWGHLADGQDLVGAYPCHIPWDPTARADHVQGVSRGVLLLVLLGHKGYVAERNKWYVTGRVPGPIPYI